MTTSTFTSPIDSDSDAHFRSWGSQISAQLAAVGLTQTADTGQVNWSTVTISFGTPTAYEVWRFNDSLQSSQPIFFKIYYGASSGFQPEVDIQIGAASDGSGNISGAIKSTKLSMGGTTQAASSYPSYISYSAADGFLGVALKAGMNGNGGLGFCISRTNDTAGVVTGDFVNCSASQQSASRTGSYSFSTAGSGQQYPPSGAWFVNASSGMVAWPFFNSSSFDGTGIQVEPYQALSPHIQIDAKKCSIIISEVPQGTSFSLAVVGLTPRTFISVGPALGDPFSAGAYGIAFLFE